MRQLSFWKMKERARAVGESGAHGLLAASLQGAASGQTRVNPTDGPQFRLHRRLGGDAPAFERGATPPKPVASAFLVQGALSLWAYCADIMTAILTPGILPSHRRGYDVLCAARWSLRAHVHDTAVVQIITNQQFCI